MGFCDSTAVSRKIANIRKSMAEKDIDLLMVSGVDYEMWAQEAKRRMLWLTNFSGSSGTVIVTRDDVLLFVDRIYSAQSQKQSFKFVSVIQKAKKSVEEWLAENLVRGQVLGMNSESHTVASVRRYIRIAEQCGCYVSFDTSEIKKVIDSSLEESVQQANKPETSYVKSHDSDVSFQEKCGKCFAHSSERAVWILYDATEIAWLTNTRGNDIATIPVARSRAMVYRKETGLFSCELFLRPGTICDEIYDANISLYKFDQFKEKVSELSHNYDSFLYDPLKTPHSLLAYTKHIRTEERHSPIAGIRAIKSSGEIAGLKNCLLQESIAFTRFLHWISQIPLDGTYTELCASKKLEEFRREFPNYYGWSFESISAFASNSVMMHYRPKQESTLAIKEGIYLIDAGGQYSGEHKKKNSTGTTDTTRTVFLGNTEPTLEQKKFFTHVLKSYISAASIHFPRGTSGAQLDAFARLPLWSIGLDFPHATGHGVGYFISVHEYPPLLSGRETHTQIEENMVFTIEPACYVDTYGIRIENLLMVKKSDRHEGFLMLEDIIMVPLGRRLIETKWMSDHEISWVNRYHENVFRSLKDAVPENTKKWLEIETAPL